MGFTNFIPGIVSPMEHKRDATVAGLGWPSTSNRGTSSTDPDTRPDRQTVELSASDASPPTTSITSASLEPNIALNDPGTTSPMDTYSAPTQHGVPFPTHESSTFNVFHHARFSSRVVHQIHFKIYTHSNNTGVIYWRDPNLRNLQMSWPWTLFLWSFWQLGVVSTNCGLLAPSLWDPPSTRAPSFSQCAHWDDISCRWT